MICLEGLFERRIPSIFLFSYRKLVPANLIYSTLLILQSFLLMHHCVKTQLTMVPCNFKANMLYFMGLLLNVN